MDHRIGVLGRIEAWDESGAPADVGGRQRWRLLLILAAARGRPVEDADIFDRLWPTHRPAHAIASLRNSVADVRRALGREAVERTRRGYRLAVEHCPLDLDSFERLVDAARSAHRCGEDEEALQLLDQALGIVRGQPFDPVADEPWAAAAAAAAAEHVASAEEFWAQLRLAAGRVGREIPRLRQAAAAQPHREIRWRQLVAALGAEGRRREAVAAVDQARRALAEFGLEPSVELLELEQSILGSRQTSMPTVPIRRDPIVGRSRQLTELMRGERVTWVEGHLGSGKTRLLAEFADRLDATGATVLYAACRRDGGRPVAALATEALEAAPESFEPLPDLLTLVRGPGQEPLPVDPFGGRQGLVEELARILTALAAESDTVILLDDVHDVDAGSAAIFTDLVERRTPRVRWVLAGRPRTDGSWSRLHHDLERSGEASHVTVGPLEYDDLLQLAATLEPDAAPADRASAARQAVQASQGHVLFATELLAQRLRSGHGTAIPIRLDGIVAGMLEQLGERHRRIVELLAVSGSGVSIPVLSRATCDDVVTLLRLVEDLDAAGFLAPATGDVVAFRHDAIREIVAARLPASVGLERRRRLIQALEEDGRHAVELAYQYLALRDLVEHDERVGRDRAVAEALTGLSAGLEYGAAAQLAHRFLELDDLTADEFDSVRAHVAAASALIATGDVAIGRPLLRSLMASVRRHGEPQLWADAILALGPVATGSHEPGGALADEVEALVDRLDPSDGVRRVQLCCWGAHHLVNRGERAAALELLDRAGDVMTDVRPIWGGLVLAVRAQADLLVDAPPDLARQSHRRLFDDADRHGDLSTAAAARLITVSRSFADGTVDDVRHARDAIADIAASLPRPDLQWWPAAIDAAIALATGDDAAEAAIEHAEQLGQRLGVEISSAAGLAQRSLLLHHSNRLGDIVEVIRPAAERADAVPAILGIFGMACLANGERDAAQAVADRLCRAPHLLRSAGMAWPQVAMAATSIAFDTEHVELARRLWAELVRHCGTGLAMSGVGYYGTADRCLAQLAMVLDEGERARVLAQSAHRQELRRGTTAWVRSTAELADQIACVA